MKKQKNRKNLKSDAALKAKMKEQPWWQKKKLVKLKKPSVNLIDMRITLIACDF